MMQGRFMTRQRLEQYASLKREIRSLEARLRADHTTADTVKGSMLAFPYTPHTITIMGDDTKTVERLQRRGERLSKERAEIEAYIDGIPDSLVRQLITLRYVHGLPWRAVAANVGSNTEDSVRKTVERFLQKA